MRTGDRCRTCNGSGVTPRRYFVYAAFDADGNCLYVGRSTDPSARWYGHQSKSPEMAELAVRFRVMGPYTFEVASEMEVEQQILLRPSHCVIRAVRKARMIARRLNIDISDVLNVGEVAA